MAGRFAYLMMAGAAVVGGMFLQGDIKFNADAGEIAVAQALIGGDKVRIEREVDRQVDREVDRIVDRETKDVVRVEQRISARDDAATKRALSDAIAELVRAEGSLITARLDDETPSGVIKQAEERRNAARETVDRLAEEAKAESRGDRGALRENIRATVRDAVRR